VSGTVDATMNGWRTLIDISTAWHTCARVAIQRSQALYKLSRAQAKQKFRCQSLVQLNQFPDGAKFLKYNYYNKYISGVTLVCKLEEG